MYDRVLTPDNKSPQAEEQSKQNLKSVLPDARAESTGNASAQVTVTERHGHTILTHGHVLNDEDPNFMPPLEKRQRTTEEVSSPNDSTEGGGTTLNITSSLTTAKSKPMTSILKTNLQSVTSNVTSVKQSGAQLVMCTLTSMNSKGEPDVKVKNVGGIPVEICGLPSVSLPMDQKNAMGSQPEVNMYEKIDDEKMKHAKKILANKLRLKAAAKTDNELNHGKEIKGKGKKKKAKKKSKKCETTSCSQKTGGIVGSLDSVVPDEHTVRTLNMSGALLGSDLLKEDMIKQDIFQEDTPREDQKGEEGGCPVAVKTEPEEGTQMEPLDIKFGPQGELLLPFNLSVQYVKQEEVKQEVTNPEEIMQECDEQKTVKSEGVQKQDLTGSEITECEKTLPLTFEKPKRVHPRTVYRLKRMAKGKRLTQGRLAKRKGIVEGQRSDSIK